MGKDPGKDSGFLSARTLLIPLLLLLTFGLLGAAAGLLRPPPEKATGTILLNPLDGNPFSTTTRGDNLANLTTEAELVTSTGLLDRVTTATGTTLSHDDLRAAASVEVPTNTQLMNITVQSRNPETAVLLAQSFAVEFLVSRRDRAVQRSETQIDSLNAEIEDRKKERADLEAELTAGAREDSAISAQLDSLNAQILSLRSRIAQLRAGPFDAGQVVTPASLQAPSALRQWWVLAALGAICGLLLGAMVVWIRSRPGGRGGRALLAAVTPADLSPTAPARPDRSQSDGAAQPVLRELALRILTARRQRPLTLLLTASAGRRAQTATALAQAIAATGTPTVLIEADAASPTRSKLSLAGLLSEKPPALTLTPPLTTIPAGSLTLCEDLLLSPRMDRLLADLRAESGVILLSVGSADSYATRALEPHADALLHEGEQGPAPAVEADERYLGLILFREDKKHGHRH